MHEPLLLVSDLWKSYPRSRSPFWRHSQGGESLFHAVAGVELSLEGARCLGVVGESGSGKSTLVRMLSGLLPPSRGRILLAGKPISTKQRDPRERAQIQLVFQDPTESLNPAFSVRRTLEEPLRRLQGIRDPRELRQRVEQLADTVQLPHALLDRLPHQLSGGQKARVGIGRALAPGPRVLLLDEPTTALDVSVQARILLLLADLRERLRMGSLLVTHDLGVVRLLCDEVIVMNSGKIVERGSVSSVMERPEHPYTRSLVEALPSLPGAA
jgi:peptide/nickel transport system ATP-binding protein